MLFELIKAIHNNTAGLSNALPKQPCCDTACHTPMYSVNLAFYLCSFLPLQTFYEYLLKAIRIYWNTAARAKEKVLSSYDSACCCTSLSHLCQSFP